MRSRFALVFFLATTAHHEHDGASRHTSNSHPKTNRASEAKRLRLSSRSDSLFVACDSLAMFLYDEFFLPCQPTEHAARDQTSHTDTSGDEPNRSKLGIAKIAGRVQGC